MGVQVRSAIAALVGTDFGMLWFDVEQYAWSSSLTANQAFIQAMVDEGAALGVSTGIYSSYYGWEAIVGLDWSTPASAGLPLW